MTTPDWALGTVTAPDLLERASSGNLYPAAAIATAKREAGGRIPDDVSAEAQLVCPLCQSAWSISMKGIYGWMTDNAQRVCQESCPSCGACTVQVQVTIPSKETPPTIYFVATVFACAAGKTPKNLGLRLTHVQ